MHGQFTPPPDDTTAPPCPQCGGPRSTRRIKDGPRAGERYYGCKPCQTKRNTAYRLKHREQRYSANREYNRQRHAANPERMRERVKQYYAANPEPAKLRAKLWNADNPERRLATKLASRAVAKAIHQGILTRPDTCEECGVSGVTIQAAHHDYSRPLDVRWLCRSCHSIWDRQEPKTLL